MSGAPSTPTTQWWSTPPCAACSLPTSAPMVSWLVLRFEVHRATAVAYPIPWNTHPVQPSASHPFRCPATAAVDAKSKYGVTPTGNGDCKVNRWLLPDACLLPVPFPLLVQLSEWERTSHNLTVAFEAEQAFQGEPPGACMPLFLVLCTAVGLTLALAW